MQTNNIIIETHDLTKTYFLADPVYALRGVSITIEKGEFIAIMGASGSGKSTFMNLLGCLDNPTSGEYMLDGIDTSKLSSVKYADVRNQKIGFVFQGFNLIPRTNALENVMLPLLYDHRPKAKKSQERARWALDVVGLSDRMDHVPNQLSGGQQQRVAIARALVNEPAIILADEPTGNLDTRTSYEIMSVFQELNDNGITVIMVTHEPDIALYSSRIIELRDGRLRRDYPVQNRRNAKFDLEHFVEEDAIIGESL